MQKLKDVYRTHLVLLDSATATLYKVKATKNMVPQTLQAWPKNVFVVLGSSCLYQNLTVLSLVPAVGFMQDFKHRS